MPLTSGTRLGPYEIIDSVGAGGMGEVYRARDPRLGRDVAIKVMSSAFATDAEWLRRFEQEARAAASLSHPNVLSVFDVGKGEGVSYVVMELLEGETLRQRLDRGALPVRKAIEIALQILAGLGSAHARGIIHRDLKPENIFLTRQGQAKILDFGLAKVTPPGSAASSADAQTMISQPGIVVGTASYMAPEQARGLHADARSDLFSFGAILYEMLSGERAFRGVSLADMLSAILKEEPQSLIRRGIDAPPALNKIVTRCLEKDPADRFQSARDTTFALESLSDVQVTKSDAPEKPKEKSIAVLPFTNMGGDAEQEYFSDGLAEELINALAGLKGLRVVSRTSAFRFRGRDLDIREIAKQLSVETVLEGSVRRAGKRLRITAQLVNAADGYHLWSQRYDRELEDVFAIQDEITESIVKTLRPALLGEAQAAPRRHTDNVEAYQSYLKGQYLWQQRSESSLRSSIEYFQRAITLDSEYALAYAGIADALSILHGYGYISDADSRAGAEAAARRAMELEPFLPEAHFAAGLFRLYFAEDWDSAEAGLREAARLSPNSSLFNFYFGFFLAGQHRIEEARPFLSKGIEIDPLSPLAHALSGISMYLARRPEEAIALAERSLQLQADFPVGLLAKGLAFLGAGQPDTAVEALERLHAVSPRTAWWHSLLGMAYAVADRRTDALAVREQLLERSRNEYVPASAFATIDSGLRDEDKLLDDFEECVKQRISGFILEIILSENLDSLAANPRFGDLLKRLRVYKRPV